MPDADRIVRACEETGTVVCALATGSLYTQDGLSLISLDDSVVEETLARLRLYVDFSSLVGGRVIIGCVRGNLDDKKSRRDYLVRLADGLLRLGEYGARRNISFLLEAINRYENNYLATAAETKAFIEEYDLQGYSILLDTFHMNMEERNFERVFKDAGTLLGHVHTSDSTRLVPGTARIDFRALIEELRGICYQGWLSLECCVDQDENLEAAQGLACLKQALNRIA